MRADGTGQERLTAFHREDWGPRWSPDGKRIAFLSDREGRTRIFIMNADGTKLSALTSPGASEGSLSPSGGAGASGAEGASELEPAWSPDGARVAYITRGVGKKSRVWVAHVGTGQCKPLTGGAHGDESPAWSPDGNYLVFSSDRAGDPELYLMRADGTGQTRLTHAKGPDWLPRWLPPRPAR
jgi:TolB protein